jgi:hypothetical protein
MAGVIHGAGGVQYIIEYTYEAQGDMIIPGIKALGSISQEESLAMTVIAQQGVVPLKDALIGS